MGAASQRGKVAFVTGASGTLGIHVVDALMRAGWEVHALHRPESDVEALDALGAERVTADVQDFTALHAACPRQVDAVVHCASFASLWRRHGPEQMRVNVRGTRNIVRVALARHARRLVHISCAATFGPHNGLIREDTPRCGRSSAIPMVRSKAMAEVEVERGQRSGLDAVTLHPGFLIGAHDRNNWARLFRLVAQRRLPGVAQGGASFCAPENVAMAVVGALLSERLDSARWVLGDVAASHAALAREIGRQLGHRRLLRPVPTGLLNAYARVEEAVAPIFGRDPDVTRESVLLLSGNAYVDGSRARRAFDLPSQTLEGMVARCIEWLRANGEL